MGKRGAVQAKPAAGDLIRYLATLIAIGVVYYAAARLGLRLSLVGESVTPLWPPTGIALVAYLLFGYRIAPGVLVSAFLVNWAISPSAAVAAEIAAGNTAAPAVATLLLRLVGFRVELDRTRDALALVLFAALGAMSLSATVGSLALERSGAITQESFAGTWAVWWAGDAMGVLAIAPFLLSFRSFHRFVRVPLRQVFEAVLMFAALAATAASINFTAKPVWVATFPMLVWIAWRFQQRGAGAAALLVIGSASWAGAHGDGPFQGSDLTTTMVTLQVFNAAVALTSFFFAAVVAERLAARRALEVSARELYMREHHIAETLQRSLLPGEYPDIPDLAIAAEYVPATTDVQVGGDWYDIISLPDGRIGLVVGDVAGHGVAAAAAMGHIRMALRAYALEDLSPAEALDRLDNLLLQLQPGTMATVTYCRLDLETGIMRVAKAGHPPPLIVSPDGATLFIEDGLSPPLGVASGQEFREVTVRLEPRSTIYLYTDGLIERRGESLSDGLARLAGVAARSPKDLRDGTRAIVETLLPEGSSDDTVILSMRWLPFLGRPLRFSIKAEPIQLRMMRTVLARWLRANAVADEVAEEVTLACNEACANAIQHAYDARAGIAEIEAGFSGDVLTLVVRDFGAWRAQREQVDEGTGRGIHLMRSLLDDVEIVPGPHGTEVRMTRRMHSAGHA